MSMESLKEQIIKKAWAEPAFKEKLLADPKTAIKDAFGVEVPDHIEVKALAEQPDLYYLIIPQNPEDVTPGVSSVDAAW
jgi:hypothetical protein